MKIEDKFLKLRNKLKHLNKQYYNSKPSIDDSDYDDLKKQYDFLLSKNPN